MIPEIGRDYIGPFGWRFRVVAIEDTDGYPLVVILREPQRSPGAIRFPLNQAAKWLAPIGHNGHDAKIGPDCPHQTAVGGLVF